MGGCQNYGPLVGALNIKCRTIIGIQKGPTILTTAHMRVSFVHSFFVGRGGGGLRGDEGFIDWGV